MKPLRHTITCHISGITCDPDLSIDTSSLKDIQSAVSAVRTLLSAHGGYNVDETPRIRDDVLILEVVDTQSDSPPFSPKRFDLYARNVAEFSDARNEGRAPLLTLDDHEHETAGIEAACRSLKGLEKVVIQVDGMVKIELMNHRKWHGDTRGNQVTLDVERAAPVAGLKRSREELIVSSEMAKSLHPGDSIRLESIKVTPIRRALGTLVEIVGDMDGETIDMFDPDDDA